MTRSSLCLPLSLSLSLSHTHTHKRKACKHTHTHSLMHPHPHTHTSTHKRIHTQTHKRTHKRTYTYSHSLLHSHSHKLYIRPTFFYRYPHKLSLLQLVKFTTQTTRAKRRQLIPTYPSSITQPNLVEKSQKTALYCCLGPKQFSKKSILPIY